MAWFDDVIPPQGGGGRAGAPAQGGGMFDDLIPAKPAKTGGMFDDLIPSGAGVTARGAYKALDVGLQEGVAGLASLPRTVSNLGAQGIQSAANYVSQQLGLPEDTRDLEKPGAIELPTYESALGTIRKDFGGEEYTPQNPTEEFLRTFGQFAPNVALGGGGVIRGVVAPALASETAGQLTKGTDIEPYARAAGALAGTAGAAKAGETVSMLRGYRGAPNLQELGRTVDEGYSAARASGVELNPTFVSQGLNKIAQGLTTGPDARSPRLIQKTLGLLEEEAGALTTKQTGGALQAMTGVGPKVTKPAPVDFTKLDALRRDLGEIARDFTNQTEAAVARIAQRGIDDMLERAGQIPGAVLKGDARMLAQTARDARGNAAAEFRLRAIEALRTRALDQAGSAHSGRNIENAIRQQMKGFVRPDNKGISPAMREGFTDAEIAQIRRASRGTSAPNLLRMGGNVLGGGGGIASGGLLTAGYLSDRPELYAAAGLGFGARNLSNALMRGRAANIARMTGARSPLAQARGVRPAVPPTGAAYPSLLSLMSQYQQ